MAVLKQVEGGHTVKDVCREHGESENTNYNWKSNYGGMEFSDIRRMNEPFEENRKLKQMAADLSLDKHMLQEVLSKKIFNLRFFSHPCLY